MPASLENSAVATRLHKLSFYSNLKERQCQRMFKLPHNSTHFICQQSNVQNSPSQAITVHEPRTDVQTGFIKGRGTRDQISNIFWIIKKNESSRKKSNSTLASMPKPLSVWNTTLLKILQEMEISDHLTCLLRNLYAGQEATVRTIRGTMTWFQIGKGERQGCMLSLYLFTLYAEYIV